MTEAMSRREIEDVLTSIKRLVSQDIPARNVEAGSEKPPEKLLLTAELRVTEPEDTPGAQETVAPSDDPLVLDPALAETASDTGAPTARADSDAVQGSVPQAASLPASGPLPVVNLVQDGAGLSLIRRIANARGAPNLGERTGAGAFAPHTEASVDQTEQQPEQFLGPFVDPIEDAALEQTLARLEAVLSGKPVPPPSGGGGSDQFHPSRSETDTPSRKITAFEKGVEHGVENAVDQIIDESMLYQLVAQIVRQELQGELGEKITRNIRKLVRQEVARELQLRRN